MSTVTETPLTAADVIALYKIVRGVQTGAKFRRLLPEGGDVMSGAVRAILQPRGASYIPYEPYLATEKNDIRECRLWVTAGGFEHFWEISELLPEIQATTFAIYQEEEI